MNKFTKISSVLSSTWRPAGTIGLDITCFQTLWRVMYFCKSYSTRSAPDRRLTSSVPQIGSACLSEIREWISEHFAPAITLRSKIAHGQRVKPFTNTQGEWLNTKNFSICGSSIASLKDENVLTTTIKVQLIKEISVTINNLAVDSHVYKAENFDERYGVVSSIIEKLASADYPAFKQSISGTFKPPA